MATPGGNLYTFRVDEKRLRAHVRDLEGRFLRGNQAVLRANQQSVQWLATRASKNLQDKVKRAKDFRNPIPLAEIVANPDASIATPDGFEFLVHERIQALSERAARYYRAIEFGYDLFVGKDIALIFYGPFGRGGQAAWGRKAGSLSRHGHRLPVVTIENAIPAYLYADTAVESFIRGRVAGTNINKELRSEGLLN